MGGVCGPGIPSVFSVCGICVLPRPGTHVSRRLSVARTRARSCAQVYYYYNQNVYLSLGDRPACYDVRKTHLHAPPARRAWGARADDTLRIDVKISPSSIVHAMTHRRKTHAAIRSNCRRGRATARVGRRAPTYKCHTSKGTRKAQQHTCEHSSSSSSGPRQQPQRYVPNPEIPPSSSPLLVVLTSPRVGARGAH